jgi:Arf-GAP/Rho-GAP domain/ANK repeat/PH domain-containing protein 3
VGEQSGHKADANNVSKSMRKARNIDGSFLFDASEYLTAKQIAGFFSRLARKRRAAQVSESKEEEEELEAQLEEEGIENLARNIINEIGLIHPIMFDTYNLCDLATGSKLSKFSISMLQEICTFYDLDTSYIKATRKKPYIEILTNFIGNCTCQEYSSKT